MVKCLEQQFNSQWHQSASVSISPQHQHVNPKLKSSKASDGYRHVQEGSKDLHHLLDHIADSKMRALGLARGRDSTDHERSIFLMNLRRELSTAAAKANSACLLGRLSKLGEGHRQAAKRRVWVRREQEMREEANRAHWLANIRGRGIIRGGGEFFSI